MPKPLKSMRRDVMPFAARRLLHVADLVLVAAEAVQHQDRGRRFHPRGDVQGPGYPIADDHRLLFSCRGVVSSGKIVLRMRGSCRKSDMKGRGTAPRPSLEPAITLLASSP
jgi:hypothetical protein